MIHLESLQRTEPPRPSGFCISKNASITRSPLAERADGVLKSLLDWFEGDEKIDPVLGAGLARLGCVTIHPFDDGNGRIARAIANMALARSENSPQKVVERVGANRAGAQHFYDILEHMQKGTMDITSRIEGSLAASAAPSMEPRKP